jgi:hypothetical protein
MSYACSTSPSLSVTVRLAVIGAVLLPGLAQGQGDLVSCHQSSPRGVFSGRG